MPGDSSLMSTLVPILALVLLLAAIFAVLGLWLRSLGRRVAEDVVAALGGRSAVFELEKSANCLGVRSKGHGQVRGNGCLALTADEIVFRMWIPSRITRVPLDSITAVDTGRAFMGKASPLKHVRVTWTSGEGPDDETAWIVRDAERWQTAIKNAVGRKKG